MRFLDRLFGNAGHGRTPPDEARTLGRNKLCWCGSGKKYKRCHREADARFFSRELAATCSSGG